MSALTGNQASSFSLQRTDEGSVQVVSVSGYIGRDESTKLKIGQVLQIPVASEPHGAPATQRQPGAAESDVVLYEIKPGDTLSKIANAHGTTVKAFQAANTLKSDALVIGQKLKLPDLKVAKSPASPSPGLQP